MIKLVILIVFILFLGIILFVLWRKKALVFAGKEKRTQLYFREDGKFHFRKLEVEDTFLVEKRNGKRFSAWKLAYKLQLPFAGFKDIKRDNVTVSFARDIIFDPFDVLPAAEKPDRSKNISKPWITSIAESQGYTAQHESSRKLALSTQMSLLGGAVLLMAVCLMVVIFVNVL